MDFAKDSGFVAIHQNVCLPPGNKARVIALCHLVFVVKVVQQRAHFACGAVEVGVVCARQKAKALYGAGASVFLAVINIGDFSHLEDFVRVHRVAALTFGLEQACDDGRADELVVFAHRICDFDNVLSVYAHVVDVCLL